MGISFTKPIDLQYAEVPYGVQPKTNEIIAIPKNKQVMVFDEFDIHPEKEAERKILDWERTYFLTKYYCI